jgi:hypothetical protein
VSKVIPKILSDHILPFNWDVRIVWSQHAEISRLPFSDFHYLLDLPLWSSVPNRGMLFDISPREVISFPQRSPHQYSRVLKASIEFPIDLIYYREKRWILDGVHRLAKLSLLKVDFVDSRIHSEAVIPHISARAEQGAAANP